MAIRIKKEFLNTRIGFNGSAKPLGERTDLDVLARIASEGNDPSLKALFETDPDETEWRESLGEKFLEQNEKQDEQA